MHRGPDGRSEARDDLLHQRLLLSLGDSDLGAQLGDLRTETRISIETENEGQT